MRQQNGTCNHSAVNIYKPAGSAHVACNIYILNRIAVSCMEVYFVVQTRRKRLRLTAQRVRDRVRYTTSRLRRQVVRAYK